jgi:hypothetical protein
MDALATEPMPALGAETKPQVRALPSRSKAMMFIKNVAVLAFAAAAWLAIDTGYFGPDRPTRPQWARLQKASALSVDRVTYRADFGTVKIDVPVAGGTWGRYNFATPETTEFDATGVTVNYQGAAWLGASVRLASYVPDRIYRITFDAEVEGQPGAILVRNRQMDIHREQIPIGKKQHVGHFLSPNGARNEATVIFMPDDGTDPKGKLRITSFKIELLKE